MSEDKIITLADSYVEALRQPLDREMVKVLLRELALRAALVEVQSIHAQHPLNKCAE